MKKNKKRNKKPHNDDSRLLKGQQRADLILNIVKSDSTFQLYTFKDGEQVWVGKCIHCNARLTVPLDGHSGFTVEHIVPRSAGGTNDLENIALACGGCNSEKGIRHDADYGSFGHAGRATEVITMLLQKRKSRWRDPTVAPEPWKSYNK